MALKSVKYIELDDQKGILYSAGKQALLMPVTFIRAIDSIFNRLAGRGDADSLIYLIGKGLGTEYARALKTILRKEQASISLKTKIQMACNAIFMESGWGRARVRKIDAELHIVEIALRRSPSTKFLKKNAHNIERGILAGMYETIAGQKVYCELLKTDKVKHEIVLRISKNIPAEAEKQENLALIARQELKQNITELQKLRKNLDEKVKKRTAELQIAKEAAEKERDKTSAVIQNFADGLLIIASDMTIALANPQAEKIIGLPKEKIENKKLSALSQNNFLKKLTALVSEDGSIKRIFRQNIETGEKTTTEITSIPLSGKNLSAEYLIILRDVSREKAIEKTKTEFITVAAHQLRTPLSAVKWHLNFLKQGDAGELNQEQKNLVEKSRESNERMLILINDLLDVAKMEEGRYLCEPAPAKLENLARTALDSCKQLAIKRGISIEFAKPTDFLPEIMADAEKIVITMQNLIENAIKYTKSGGKISIAVKHSGDLIEFSVKDSGVGISEEQRKKLFTKFFRGDKAMLMETEGSGLGLFIAKNIVEAHGGKIWCESAKNKGSVFSFSLPISRSAC